MIMPPTSNNFAWKWFAENALAGFEDFGVGAFIVSILAIMWRLEAPLWVLAIGGILALLPDFDLIIPILRRSVVGNHHMTLMHRPLFLVPVATAICFVLGGTFLSAAAFLCVLWHFVHDSPETGGGGIAWLWPMSHKMFSLRGKEIHPHGSDHAHYLKTSWARPNARSAREIAIGSVCLIAALLLSMPSLWWVGLLIVPLVWIMALVLWHS